ncbi:MAG: FAD-binding oxidoreductase [Ardenticatenaceae bacterium]|nr:FAD-binding oxidoreductase [Ardenticatenaceae bacterium]
MTDNLATKTKKRPGRKPQQKPAPLPDERLERVSGWGGACHSLSHVYRPTTIEQLQDVFRLAREHGRTVGIRGGGNSYGDPAMNAENILLDLRRMTRILEWNPGNGRIRVEPGVTLQQMWNYVLEDGWWIPVATGTMKITIGGGAGMNVHGKNAYKIGTFGDNILEFDLMLPSGQIITCSRDENSDIFHAAIGGAGMLGVFTAITMQMKRVYSGLLRVQGWTEPDLYHAMDYLEQNQKEADYQVGWLDAFTKGKQLGRAEMHRADYLLPGEDPNPTQTLRLDNQYLPENILGIVPKSSIWMFQRPFWNNFGMRFVNIGKFRAAWLKGPHMALQSHAAFHFLLDYFDWRKPFGPGGLIQYQPFIPVDTAEKAFADILTLCQKRRLPNYLTVMKRHRPDPFLLTHGLDGFSMAMDFKITNRNRPRMVKLAQEMDEIVLKAGGRFYFAKDSTLHPETAVAYLGQDAVDQFKALKQRCDPDNILQSNLWRRVFS